MKAHCRLYETDDGRVVEEGDPDAARLLAAEGDDIPEADAKRLRLKAAGDKVTQGKAPDPEPVYSSVPGAGPKDASAKDGERKAASVTVKDETEAAEPRKAGSVTITPAKEDKGK
jgi:hypothetical protein